MFRPIDTLTRRDVLRGSMAAGAACALPWFIPAAARGTEGKAAPSERITLGVIGIGPRATYDLSGFLKQPDCHCVAICDVQASRREAGKRLIDKHNGNSDCALYRDFRELLARRDIDAVLIATGDRWHTPASILAAKAGKDVYSEKPCGLTIGLCQALDDVIQKTGRVFQAGTQRRSVANFQAAVQLAHSGKLGKLHTLFASVYTPSFETTWLPAEARPPRDVVDWDLWLGPAPWRPYNHRYVEGGWRGYWDFDSGAALGLGGAHGRSLPVGQQGRRHRADRIRAVREDDRRPLCQRRETRVGLPGNSLRPAPGMGPDRWGPARSDSWATKDRSRPATAAASRCGPSRSGRIWTGSCASASRGWMYRPTRGTSSTASSRENCRRPIRASCGVRTPLATRPRWPGSSTASSASIRKKRSSSATTRPTACASVRRGPLGSYDGPPCPASSSIRTSSSLTRSTNLAMPTT